MLFKYKIEKIIKVFIEMGSKNTILIYLTLIVFLTNFIVCPPLNPHPVADKEMEEEKKTDDDPILALEYHKYLREIVNVLETDPNFKKVIEGASADDIKVKSLNFCFFFISISNVFF